MTIEVGRGRRRHRHDQRHRAGRRGWRGDREPGRRRRTQDDWSQGRRRCGATRRRRARRHPARLARLPSTLAPVPGRVARAARPASRRPGIDHVVLAGMGGSSLAPEVIAATAGVRLTVLDTTDAGQVAAAIADRLEHTVLVVSSKSGGTLETDSHRRAYEQAFRDAGIDPAQRIVVVTDPGSPLEAAVAGGRLPGVPRRPQRRRPLQRAVRLRAGAERARRRRRRRAARRRGRVARRLSTATTTTPASPSAPCSVRPASPAATRS